MDESATQHGSCLDWEQLTFTRDGQQDNTAWFLYISGD